MRKNWIQTATIAAVLGCAALPGAAFAGGETPPPPPPPDDCKENAGGRMTGGGNARGEYKGKDVKVTHGFTLRCDADDHPQRLQVNWSGGNKFHLVDLVSAECEDDPAKDEGNPRAGFDTYRGAGYDKDGSYAEWRFTDEGEPGRSDDFEIRIWDNGVKDSTPDLVVNDDLSSGGNHQAHRLTGRAAR
jgi:hypothetical protein